MKLWLMVILVLGACGPSNAEIKTAKTARYTASPQTLFDIAVEVTQRDYKLADSDAASARFATEPQVYSPEGSRQSPGADGYITMRDGSIQLSLFVEVLASESGNVITITPKAFQIMSGSPKPRELAPDDPNLPGWVHGRVDTLAVDIYKAAKQHVH